MQTLEPLDTGETRIHWEVDFESWLPSGLVRALLRPKLERSLATLARIARGA